MALVSAAVFIAGGIAVGWFLARQYIDPGAAADENRAFLLSLALVFFYAYVAEFIGLSAIVGAFVAGIVLSQLSFAPRLLELFHPLGELFTPLFFLSLGMFIDVRTLVPALVPILIVIVIVFVTKIVGAGTAAALSGSSPADALRVGVGMVPRGEISLVIALLGLQSGVLDALQYSVISAMAFATTILAPLLLRPLVRR
jgi:Kef-type K+ transport system membrane component KefB